MSEPKLISPLLDGLILGEAISDHHGVRCCPAICEQTDERYIVKIVSIPAAQVQLDALLLTGACSDQDQALAYFKELSDGVIGEAEILQRLSHLEGFSAFAGNQLQQMDEGIGYDVYLLSPYRRSLERLMQNEPLTHLAAVNLGLDMCAALSVCRQAGYLYVDLKPENVFRSESHGYQIGDLGFIPLSSLKYASLPEKYRSSYTAPEISDALSSLNATMDVYALGLILYRIYNNGQLPFDGSAPAVVLPTPMYADYEIAEIILKACAPDPKDRWQDPAQMGQALVDYMQRNSINDTPIIPPPAIEEEPEDESEEFLSEEENAEDLQQLLAMIPDEVEPEQLTLEPEVSAQPQTDEALAEVAEETVDEEADAEEDQQLSFLDADALHESGVTNDVAQMLAQADDLIAHELPEPVVAPAPIDVPIPPPIVEEPEVEEEPEQPDEEAVPVITEDENEEAAEDSEPEEEIFPEYVEKPKSRRWIAAVIALILLIGAGIGVSVWYNQSYIQTVDGLQINGSADAIEVIVTSGIDESLLSVICTDTYGNSRRCPVTDGKAVFTGLNPSTQYRIRLEISGVHKLEGQTTGSYTTDAKTQILDFTAAVGPEDGSVNLKFSIDGPDADQWTVVYSAPGKQEKTHVMTGHATTIFDLTPGSDYTFRLSAPDDRLLTGTTEVTYTARNILVAQDLTVTACGGGVLRVQWQCDKETAGQKWLVRCYNNAGFDKTVTVSDMECEFTGLDHTTGYTILVTAEGMLKSAETSVSADPVNITGFNATVTDPWAMTLSWEYTGTASEQGWILSYSINGSNTLISVPCTENSAEIALSPGCTYVFSVTTAGDTDCFGESYTYGPVEVSYFEGYGVTADDMTLSTALRPDKANWSYLDLTDDDYKTTFSSGEKVSVVAHLDTTYAVSNASIVTTYVLRDSQNRTVSLDTQSETWRNMWFQRYCELDLPQMPVDPGTYILDIYFNGLFVGSVAFNIA